MIIRMLVPALLFASVSLAAPPTTEEELIAVEMAWSKAQVKRDVAALENIIADEYQFVESLGTLNKEQEIANARTGRYMLQHSKFSDLKVHVYGDVATVTGINTVAAEYKGRNVSGRYRFSNVFVKRDGRWQCILGHSSYIYRR